MAGKIIRTSLNLPGWQRGFQELGLAVLLMAAIAATMIFSFWVCSAGPFSAGKDAETANSMRFQAVNNPAVNAIHASSSENYSSDVIKTLNKLQNPTDASSQ
jgi:hypothetical protein